jgi:quinol monooxygenase YgiN
MRVKVEDVDRLVATYDRFRPRVTAAGGRSIGVFYSESDPNEVTILEEWTDHEGLLDMLEEHVGEFNASAGTESAVWENRVMHALA